MLTFPATKRYVVRFRQSDVGLTPTFAILKRLDTLANLGGPPAITEIPACGIYYFDWTYATGADPPVLFQIDGGVTIPTIEERFVSDVISVQDLFTDQAASIIETELLRGLGMVHENAVLDLTSYDGNNNLTNGRLRCYNSKTNADAARAASPAVYDTGKIAEYAITASYVGVNLTNYEMARIFP